MATTKASKHRRWRDRNRILALLSIGLGVGAVLAGVAYQVVKRPGDIHRGTQVTFTRQPPKKVKKRKKAVNWPIFGYNRQRTRYLAATGIKPPYRRLWKYNEKPLLEFPPV